MDDVTTFLPGDARPLDPPIAASPVLGVFSSPDSRFVFLYFVSVTGNSTLLTCGWSRTDDSAGLANSFAFLSHEQPR